MNTADALTHVVFDLDGLMFNTEDIYLQVGSEILRRRGKEFTQDLIDAMMGLRPAQAIGRMIEWHGLPDTVEEIERETRDIFIPLLDEHLKPMPGLLQLLADLEKAEIPKAVATSSGRAFVDEVLGRFKLGPRFAFILSAEDVTQGKTKSGDLSPRGRTIRDASRDDAGTRGQSNWTFGGSRQRRNRGCRSGPSQSAPQLRGSGVGCQWTR